VIEAGMKKMVKQGVTEEAQIIIKECKRELMRVNLG
jgi:hypothetical protein